MSWHGCGSTVAPPWPDFEIGTQLNAATAARKWYNICPSPAAPHTDTLNALDFLARFSLLPH